MQPTDTLTIEARLAAQSKVLAMIVAELDAAGLAGGLWRFLDERESFQGGEEDPGVLPTEAFGFEAAVADEIRGIAEAARRRAGDRGGTPGAGRD
jgi:hypothetical protein